MNLTSKISFSALTALNAALLLATSLGPVKAQTQPLLTGEDARREAHAAMPAVIAARLTTPIRLDGRLDDAAWQSATPATEFTQNDPAEGQPASERTEVRFLYDDDALYIGARMWDAAGDVRTRLGRRDAMVEGSDFLYIMLDSHHDHLLAYQFSVNPSGLKRDELNSGGGGGPGGNDTSWYAFWDLETSVDSLGWIAEIRIPFSQLRFPDQAEQLWGLQIQRRIIRKQELSVFAFTPKRERGGVARYGHLAGLKGLKRGRPLEVMPYAVARAEYANVDRADPFRSEAEAFGGAGIDLKYRLTSSLTVDGTINPDFGQVELDPAVVNLTAFETSFQEKRPFFVEGGDIFRFGQMDNNSQLFYSRRVGRGPQGSLPSGTQYSDRPTASTILAAAKLSGRTSNGWSLGFLEAVTDREKAAVLLDDGGTGKQIVEPYTSYFVGRARKNLRQGQTTVGLIGSAVNRKLETDALKEVLRSNAYVAGADFNHEFLNRTWSAQGFFALSHVLGSPEAMIRTQRSSSRYFHRPDADYLEVDSSATSLTGYAARLEVGKRAGLHWRGEANLALTAPNYEINDGGFQTTVDRINAGGNLTYVHQTPGRYLRDWRLSSNPNGSWNFGGEFQGGRVNIELNSNLLSNWGGQLNYSYGFDAFDDRLTRGGPSAREIGGQNVGGELHSDNRRQVSGRLRSNYSWSRTGGFHLGSNGNVTVRPSEKWSISVGPSFNRSRNSAQYLTSVEDALMTATFGRRYLFAPIEQTSLSLDTRLNINFTTDLSFDLFAQPFISSGHYDSPMQLRQPRTYNFDVFSAANGTLTEDSGGYHIDPDRDGPAAAFSIGRRDFNTRSLRGNAVLRWEWRAGSTLFLVWQQQRSGNQSFGTFDLSRDIGGVFGAKPQNVFLIKLSYWLNP